MAAKVLVVDDSAFMRKVITETIKQLVGYEVIGQARNGQDALTKIPKLQPDIITMDIEMPVLNGLETLKLLKETSSVPVLMLSSHSGEEITIEALELGAVDFIEKPQNILIAGEEFKKELADKLAAIVARQTPEKAQKPVVKRVRSAAIPHFPSRVSGIVIGASTGGPRALFELIKAIPAELNVPILIVQHMPKGFTASFAKRLNDEAKVPVVEGQAGMLISKGTVYLAPGDFHMTIERNRIQLNQNPKILGVRPAVDYLFSSAGMLYQKELVGIVMTGMGKDGTSGMAEIKKMGGFNIAQNQASSVVFGMPGSAIKAEVVDHIASLEEISQIIQWIVKEKQWT